MTGGTGRAADQAGQRDERLDQEAQGAGEDAPDEDAAKLLVRRVQAVAQGGAAPLEAVVGSADQGADHAHGNEAGEDVGEQDEQDVCHGERGVAESVEGAAVLQGEAGDAGNNREGDAPERHEEQQAGLPPEDAERRPEELNAV
jgi:hypothetical protein